MTLDINENVVLRYLQTKMPVGTPIPSTLRIKQFTDGQSNPTYLLFCDSMKLVLRKAPPGALLQGAHQVYREAMLIRAMSGNKDAPVPNVIILENDKTILGTEFFIMEVCVPSLSYLRQIMCWW